jgi:hypothetical protein
MGKSEPVTLRTSALYSPVNARKAESESSLSLSARAINRFAVSSASKLLAGTLSTTSPYICRNRRYASHANRGLLLSAARPSTVVSVSPRLRTVSIIPGMEMAAPLRTDTSRGFAGSPSFLPVVSSSRCRFALTSSRNDAGTPPVAR